MTRVLRAPSLVFVFAVLALATRTRTGPRLTRSLLVAALVHAFSPQPQLGLERVPAILARLIVEVLADDTLTVSKVS